MSRKQKTRQKKRRAERRERQSKLPEKRNREPVWEVKTEPTLGDLATMWEESP